MPSSLARMRLPPLFAERIISPLDAPLDPRNGRRGDDMRAWPMLDIRNPSRPLGRLAAAECRAAAEERQQRNRCRYLHGRTDIKSSFLRDHSLCMKFSNG